MKQLLLFLFTFISFEQVMAQRTITEILRMQSLPKLYPVQKTNVPITIDGKDNDKAWQDVPFSDSFIDIEGNDSKKPPYNTQIKMLWDDQFLYIYAKLEEPHIWGDLDQHDAIIYHNNDFEVFIKPYENQSTYFEIEVNSLNTVLDLLMNKPYRLGGEAKIHWDLKGFKSAVHIQGTNNNPHDIDKYWSIEMAIPFSGIQSFGRKITPEIGDHWRINFSRVQWQYEIINGKYIRKKENGKLMPEENWVWNPIGIINMHYPEQWGYLQFSDSETTKINYPKSSEIDRFTWNISYLQKLYKQQHKKYSTTLQQLPGFNRILDKESQKYTYELTTNKNHTFYRIQIKDTKNKIVTTLDSDGNYTINYE